MHTIVFLVKNSMGVLPGGIKNQVSRANVAKVIFIWKLSKLSKKCKYGGETSNAFFSLNFAPKAFIFFGPPNAPQWIFDEESDSAIRISKK